MGSDAPSWVVCKNSFRSFIFLITLIEFLHSQIRSLSIFSLKYNLTAVYTCMPIESTYGAYLHDSEP